MNDNYKLTGAYYPESEYEKHEGKIPNVNSSESTSEALPVAGAVCSDCGGSGVVQVPITVAGCCGRANSNGECCGDPIPVQDWDIEQCSCQYRPDAPLMNIKD